ncbi:MAG: multifunctional CCA addition/repair protein [Candidatus Thiodiazotropha endolucinida]
MQTYLVGGAVRDRLMGRPVKERDFVVVGADPDTMLVRGYQQVGSHFPVFLHPETHEEYALARSRRSADGAKGDFADDGPVTLEQDLARRDLTINAIAEDEQGRLIDPFGGREDLQRRLLRHVSDAFVDDPIRILRVARFMARYADFGFTVAPETEALMVEMVVAGRLDKLVPERVWQELSGALGEPWPRSFFETLRGVGALQRVFPEIDALWGVPQPKHWHPEVDCGEHTMLALQVAVDLSDDPEVRFATLTHDLGKATTPERILPSHYGHEARGVKAIQRICSRIKAPTRFRELACRCATFHGYLHRLYDLKPKTILKLLAGLDAFRQPQRLQQYILVCQADYQGRLGFRQRPYPQAYDLMRIYQAASEVSSATLDPTLMGRLLGDAIRQERIKRISDVMNSLEAAVD